MPIVEGRRVFAHRPHEAREIAHAPRALLRYHWPGNVRELRNAIHRACLLSVDNVVTAKSLALPVSPEPADGSHVGREAIERALLVADGVVAHADGEEERVARKERPDDQAGLDKDDRKQHRIDPRTVLRDESSEVNIEMQEQVDDVFHESV